MYCGKAYRDICNENDECSSKQCIYNRCRMQTDGPNEGEGVGVYVSFIDVCNNIINYLFNYINNI